MSGTAPGRLLILGMGPGDPELLTLKAARLLAETRHIAYFAKAGHRGHARHLAEAHLRTDAVELRFDYPVTVEIPHSEAAYKQAMTACYDAAAARVAERLAAGADVALLCEGDPFFYGSAMYLFDRLRGRFTVEVVPGIPGMVGCWAAAALPMTHGDDILAILPGTLAEEALEAALARADAAVIMKLGRNLPKVRRVIARLGRTGRAYYIERGTMAEARVLPLAEMAGAPAPYFSMILIPGRETAR
ncbi:precorrin-2 C(20)-methyltransferase [Acidisoma sp. C75]